jgi:hypothetical protein
MTEAWARSQLHFARQHSGERPEATGPVLRAWLPNWLVEVIFWFFQ